MSFIEDKARLHFVEINELAKENSKFNSIIIQSGASLIGGLEV